LQFPKLVACFFCSCPLTPLAMRAFPRLSTGREVAVRHRTTIRASSSTRMHPWPFVISAKSLESRRPTFCCRCATSRCASSPTRAPRARSFISRTMTSSSSRQCRRASTSFCSAFFRATIWCVGGERERVWLLFKISTGKTNQPTSFSPSFFFFLQNLAQNKRTLLPKFFGLFCYTNSIGRNIRFIVMNNILPSHLSYFQKYDLKGSTFKRAASEKERAKKSPTYKVPESKSPCNFFVGLCCMPSFFSTGS
jgi:hypothetical protein